MVSIHNESTHLVMNVIKIIVFDSVPRVTPLLSGIVSFSSREEKNR